MNTLNRIIIDRTHVRWKTLYSQYANQSKRHTWFISLRGKYFRNPWRLSLSWTRRYHCLFSICRSHHWSSCIKCRIKCDKDEDFVILHNADQEPCSLCWVRVGNTRRKNLLEWFERLLPVIVEKLHSGKQLIELSWCYRCKCLTRLNSSYHLNLASLDYDWVIRHYTHCGWYRYSGY